MHAFQCNNRLKLCGIHLKLSRHTADSVESGVMLKVVYLPLFTQAVIRSLDSVDSGY